MIFDAKDMGDNVCKVCENDDCAVFRLRDEGGEGIMTVYDVFPGVYLLYNDFHMEHCFSGFRPKTEMFCIDHCREGRIEWKVEQNKYVYIEAGDVQINSRTYHCQDFRFPLKHYHGLTIGFCIDEAGESLRYVMDGFSVDIRKLKEKFCPENKAFIMRAGKQIEHVFSELYHLADHVRMQYFRIKVLELLLFLDAAEVAEEGGERPYFYRSQVEKVKDIVSLLTDDLEQRYTLDDLSERFNFPLTSMKLCFKGVYGTSIYAYMKSYRMNAAALMLKNTEDSVVMIAGRVGYENASKFASAFQSVIGMSPSEYRKSAV
ncbi:AraC family transcriptional regulator [Kineothrix alysoides]|uniref:AraC family transcriptional regulator n=1 Tax=Kineothrix alysoides TaxID=1469948 RepID=A0A4R1R116_9FIRM|nr:AraC family transcriptional regulator [Kineothrix alysoides]TCL59020.1 AraC family transcriptional regulator [Kineothrix alysoides]